jgi:hypothetical protein
MTGSHCAALAADSLTSLPVQTASTFLILRLTHQGKSHNLGKSALRH